EAGAAVTTPWLESAVSPASDGSWIAVVRTGSNERSGLMSARSTDRGRTWSPVEPVVAGQDREPVAGKLPGLLLFRNGALVLLTAHSRLGCRIHLSADGTGREWSEARLVAERSGGNTSMVALDENRLLVFTPENRRIRCWRVTVRP
ncbi:MAG: sialidase family protein, partial [Verrucomicrobiales bacterium]